MFLLSLMCYKLFKIRVRLIDSCITILVPFFFFFTVIASSHLRVLSLFPLSLFDSMCGNKCDVATLSVACLIFSLSLIFYRAHLKVPFICRPEANPCVVDAGMFLSAALNYFYHKKKKKGEGLRQHWCLN